MRMNNFKDFKQREFDLLSDWINYTWLDSRLGNDSPGRQKIDCSWIGKHYCQTLIKIIKASFGQDKKIRIVIFDERGKRSARSAHLVACHLGIETLEEGIFVEPIESTDLAQLRERIEVSLEPMEDEGEAISPPSPFSLYGYLQYLEDVMHNEDQSYFNYLAYQVFVSPSGEKVPSIYFSKPNQARYWNSSKAYFDGFLICADIWKRGDRSRF